MADAGREAVEALDESAACGLDATESGEPRLTAAADTSWRRLLSAPARKTAKLAHFSLFVSWTWHA
jgi:hypothetical protein